MQSHVGSSSGRVSLLNEGSTIAKPLEDSPSSQKEELKDLSMLDIGPPNFIKRGGNEVQGGAPRLSAVSQFTFKEGDVDNILREIKAS
jgi:hypothetical protein